MIKSMEFTAKTEDEAIALAVAELGMERDELSVEVLERSKSGFLGIGAVPARIKVSFEVEISREEQLSAFLSGLLERMDVEAGFSITVNEDGSLLADLTGENLGALIGRRGETLDAIQHLCNYALNRGDGKHVRISVDAENYRAKREEALIKLAEKMAGKVIRYRRNMTLEPMNSYERHVIHTALQDYKGVSTFSTGSEPNRRVVVAYGEGRTSADAGRRRRN